MRYVNPTKSVFRADGVIISVSELAARRHAIRLFVMWKRVGICSGLLLSQVSGLTVPAANKVSSPMSSAIGRRTLLAGGAATVGAAVLASPDAAFAAANAGSDGKWAQRYDEFTDEDFKDFSTSPSGLQYKIIEEGFGVKPVSGQKIKAHYAGYLLNGAKFDSS